jgi:hypothetical protein
MVLSLQTCNALRNSLLNYMGGWGRVPQAKNTKQKTKMVNVYGV